MNSGPVSELSVAGLWLARAVAAVVGFRLGRILDGKLLPHLAAQAGHPSPPRWLRAARSRRVGFLTGAAFLACFGLQPPILAVGGCIFLLGLIGAALIDADHMIIPDLFTIGLAAAGVVLSWCVPALHAQGSFLLVHAFRSAAAALLGLLVGSSLALWMGITAEFVLGREALGFGDVKFLGAIGTFCGWQGAVFSLFGGAAIGLVVLGSAAAGRWAIGRAAGPRAVSQCGAVGLGVPFPFGPMLAAAAALHFLVLGPAVDRYLDQYLIFFR